MKHQFKLMDKQTYNFLKKLSKFGLKLPFDIFDIDCGGFDLGVLPPFKTVAQACLTAGVEGPDGVKFLAYNPSIYYTFYPKR